MANPILTLERVEKVYPSQPSPLRVLSGVDLQVNPGDSVAVIGPSGCGKSTLLNLIGLLDRPSSGSIRLKEWEFGSLSETESANLRNREIGFVFQLHHLLPQCSTLENVLVPTLVNKDSGDRLERARALLKRVGLAERAGHLPGQLSGGERQRAAVVRALINRPSLLLADEPTGSLNQEGAEHLAQLLLELNREEAMTLIVVTHSNAIAAMMDRVFELKEGVLRERASHHG